MRERARFELLREALPYIQRFQGKIFVIKLSGKVTESEEVMLSLAEEMTLFHQVGFQVVVVHGGGKQLTRIAEKLGVPQKMVNGRRVTDTQTLEVAKMVFAGQIQTDLISTFRKLGVNAVGISGVDSNVIHATRREAQPVKNRETGEEEWVDFGHVGDVVDVDVTLLQDLLAHGYLPVVSSLGADEEGNVYNINADTIASEIAIHLEAEKLLLLSNVNGVYRDFNDPDTKISQLTLQETRTLVGSQQIAAGMVPKLTAIIDLLDRGVKQAHILNGQQRNVLLQEVFTDEGSGTMFFQED